MRMGESGFFYSLILQFIHVFSCISGLFFLLLSSISLYGCTIICSSIYLLMDILGTFPFFIISNKAVTYIQHKCLYGHMLFSLWYVSRRGMARPYGRCMFSFLSNCSTIFQSDCATLHSHQQYVRVPSFSMSLLTNIFCGLILLF